MRGADTSHQILTIDTDSIPPLLIRLSRIGAILLAVAGAGFLYWEHTNRLRRIARHEAKSRRLVRKLIERRKFATPTPLYDVTRRDSPYVDRSLNPNVCLQCQFGRCNIRNHCPIPSINQSILTRPQLLSSSTSQRNLSRPSQLPTEKLFRSSNFPSVSPSSVCSYPDFSRGAPDGEDSPCDEDYGEEFMEKEEEDDGEGNKDKTMKDVIRTAKEVRRLIRDSSVISSSCEFGSFISDREFELEGEYIEVDLDGEFFSTTDRDFRNHLQLTTIDDSFSDTRSVRRRSVLSTSPSSLQMDLDCWDWDDEEQYIRGERDWGEGSSTDEEQQESEGERRREEESRRKEEGKRQRFSPDMKVVIKLGDITQSSPHISM